MNRHFAVAIPPFFIIAVTIVGMLVLFSANVYGRYLRLSRAKTALLMLVALAASVGFGIYRRRQFADWGLEDQDVISIGFAMLLPWGAVPFLANLYLRWIAGILTDAEKAPGAEGVRAWLRAGNLICVVLISLCLWLGLGYSFWIPMLLCLMAVLAYPVMNMAATPNPTAAPAADTLSPERERVLKMLDDGKITAQESAELLNALGNSAPRRAPQSVPTASHRKIVWIGAALVLIGFFLPWFAFNPQHAVNDLMRRMPMPQGMQMPNLGGMMPEGSTFYIAGGDISHGLGWCVLLLGIMAAVLPFVSANLDSQTCQKICIAALGVGTIILIYLLTQNVRYIGVGILLGMAGYVLEFIGVLKERRLDWARAL